MEIFGPTIQGEGALIGQATHFVRFGGCGFRCSWCDSMYAVDATSVKEHGKMMSYKDVYNHLNKLPLVPWITLSGGDPCLNKEMFAFDPRWKWAVETQGQFFPHWLHNVDLVTLSPKPPSSGMPFNWQTFSNGIFSVGLLPSEIVLKVVVVEGNEDDWDFACTLAREFSNTPFYFQPMSPLVNKYISAKYRTEDIWHSYNWLCNKVLGSSVTTYRKAKTCVLPQLHTLAFIDGEASITQGLRVDIKERI